MPFERLVDRNDKITKDFKQIAKESFSSIFNALGKNDFKRWVQIQRFSKDVEEMIFEWMSEEEKSEHPTWDGFANKSTKTIKIRKPETAKGVSIHEVYHLLSNSHFCTYLDEGITEYLKGMSSEEGAKTYGENVKMVSFLHEMMGDSIIKAYLMGKENVFDEKFLDLICINPDSRELEKLQLDRFYATLNDRHWALYPKKEDDVNNQKEKMESTKKQVQDMVQKIIYGKVHKMAQNFEFYKDGNLDFNYAHSVILDYLKKAPIGFNLKEKYDLEVSLLGEIYELSHLGVENDSNKKDAEKKKIVDSILSYEKNGGVESIKYNQVRPENVVDGEDVALKIFEKQFENTNNVTLTEFSEKVLNIASKFDMSKRQLDALISQYAIKIYGNKANVALIDNLIKANIDKIKLLNYLGRKKEEKTIESKYRKIGDNEYIEKRDNQFFYVRVDETGKMTEAELSWHSIGDKVKIERMQQNEISEKQKNGKAFYRIMGNDAKTTIISVGQLLQSVEIHNRKDKYKDFGVFDFDEFKEYELVSSVLNQMREKILTDYRIVNNDAENPYKIDGVYYTADIDKRSRGINVSALQEDIQNLGQVLPKNKAESIRQIFIEDVLDKIYGTLAKKQENGSYKRDDMIQSAYDSIRRQLIYGQATNESIEDDIKLLNQARMVRVEENNKHTLVGFRDELAKKEYFRQGKIKDYLSIQGKKRKVEEHIRYFPSSKYCEIEGDLESPKAETYGLNGVYIVGKVKDDRYRRINIDKLIEDMPEITQGIKDSKVLDKLQRKVVEKVVSSTYLLNQRNLRENPELKEIYDSLCTSILNKATAGIELDEEDTKRCIDKLNEERRKNQRYGDGYLIGFMDKSSEIVYNQLSKLSQMLTEHEFRDVAEGIVTAHNLMYKKGEKNAEIEQR